MLLAWYRPITRRPTSRAARHASTVAVTIAARSHRGERRAATPAASAGAAPIGNALSDVVARMEVESDAFTGRGRRARAGTARPFDARRWSSRRVQRTPAPGRP